MYTVNIYMDKILFRTDYRRDRDEAQYLMEEYIKMHKGDTRIMYTIGESDIITLDTDVK